MPTSTLPLEELAALSKFAFVMPSYSGDKIAFYWDKTGRFELYLMHLETKELKQLTNGQAPKGLRAGFVWTRDDKHIIFAKDTDGDEKNNLYKLNLETLAVEQLTKEDSQEYAGQVSPDNKTLSLTSTRAGQMNLYKLNLSTLAYEQLTEFKNPAFGGKWSPDGQWLSFNSNESSNLNNTDGYLVKHDGSELKKVLSIAEGSSDSLSSWHPDGNQIAFTTDRSGSDQAGILSLDSGEIRYFGQEGIEETAQRFSGDGKYLVTLRNQDASVKPILYNLETGEEKQLKLPEGMASGSSFVLSDRKFLLTHSSANRRPELLLYDLARDSYEVLLEADYGSIDSSLFVEESYIHYESFDGQKVPALLYAPKKIEGKLPALVMVHGGPTAQYFRGFDTYAQFLTSLGYVVLQPNIRGSTGYGVAWRDANIKDWGGGDLEDVVAGANYLKNLDYVDENRIGVFGGSFGGYMSFIAVSKKPDVFKVGIPWIGITDLHTLHEEDMEHFKYYFQKQMGDPVEDYDLWRDRSAIEFADQVTAKLLIMHGTNDPRCPISQARVFRNKLLALGKTEGAAATDDFEYHEFADEGHGPSGDIQGTIRTYKLLADFMERRL